MAGEGAGSLSGRRVLLGVTGGIAAYKAAHLVRLLAQGGAGVQVVMTPSALRFVGTDTFRYTLTKTGLNPSTATVNLNVKP